jgi:hypothetical protein
MDRVPCSYSTSVPPSGRYRRRRRRRMVPCPLSDDEFAKVMTMSTNANRLRFRKTRYGSVACAMMSIPRGDTIARVGTRSRSIAVLTFPGKIIMLSGLKFFFLISH